jgi:hypothetical protein
MNIMEKFKETQNKIIEFLSQLKLKISPKLIELDTKFATFMPNPKIRKIVYIAVSSLFGFMFLIIIIGILVAPLRNKTVDDGILIKKPNVTISTPEPQKELNKTQKEILKLQNDINNVTFPESELNIPVIERGLTL